MLIYEYKLDGSKQQYAAIDEAIRITQFIRNKCLRLWMDERGTSKNEYTESVVGIDMGLKVFYADSNGNTVPNPRHYRKAEKKLKRLHRQVSRKQKKSQNRKKARKQLARAYLKVQWQREDFARKQASTLVSSHDLIAYKQLQIRNMVKNHHLAKSIHDAGWGTFLRWVNYYGGLHDIAVIAVAPQFTSQDCSEGMRTYPGAQGNGRAYLVKRFWIGCLYSSLPTEDEQALTLPCIRCRGVSGLA